MAFSILAREALAFGTLVIVLALASSLLVQAALSSGLRRVINRSLTSSWAKRQGRTVTADSIPFAELPYPKFCGQLATVLQAHFAGDRSTETKAVGALFEVGAERSSDKPAAAMGDQNVSPPFMSDSLEADQKELSSKMRRAELQLDGLQVALGSAWARIDTSLAILGCALFLQLFGSSANAGAGAVVFGRLNAGLWDLRALGVVVVAGILTPVVTRFVAQRLERIA